MQVYYVTKHSTKPQDRADRLVECAICSIPIGAGLLCSQCHAWQAVITGSELAVRGVCELERTR